MLTDRDWAYAAGFFDGEGHIRIQRHSVRCRTMLLGVGLSQATLEPLDWFKANFGGTVHGRTAPYRGGHRVIYSWQASSGVAERFLRGLLPFLKIKKDEAELALQFRATFRPQHVAGGHKRMTDAEIDRRVVMADELKRLRKRKREIAAHAVLAGLQ